MMRMMRVGVLAVVSLAFLALAGCATSEQWNTWRSHDTHFASGQHMGFSVRNPGPTAEKVRATDPAKAQDEKWWGKQVTMSQ